MIASDQSKEQPVESVETEGNLPSPQPERLPWITPRLNTIKFQDSEGSHFSLASPDGVSLS